MAPSSALANLDLLIVSNDYSTLKMFVYAWRETGSRLDSTPSITCARDFVQNRKMHGIVIDMQVNGAFGFISQVRKSSGSAAPIIVACTGNPQEESEALAAGANFVVQKPISTGRIFDLLSLNGSIQAPQRRRYLRHPLVAPVTILSGATQLRALTSDLSESGMSIRSVQMLAPDTPLKFAFELPSTTAVTGLGKIMWVNDEGYAGIKFNSVLCSDGAQLGQWLGYCSMVMSS
jgi:CheY-like chemotaxis protein